MSIQVDEEFYVKLPKHELYVQELNGLYLKFARFFNEATSYTEKDALEIAKDYSLEVVERTITTTTEIELRTIFKGE